MTEQSCPRNERIKFMTVRSSPLSTFDIAVIGAGVVGCAVFREFVLAGARTIILERDADFLNGASKGNSGLLHTGFDAQPDTLEAKCVRDGYRTYGEIHERLKSSPATDRRPCHRLDARRGRETAGNHRASPRQRSGCLFPERG